MRRFYVFNLKQAIRNKSEMFWSLLFPVILGTLFALTFGNGSGSLEKMNPIPVALTGEDNPVFETFLQSLDGETLLLTEMEEEDAIQGLKDGTIEGIFYSKKEPSLTVAGSQINESILGGLLNGYLENQWMMEEIGKNNPLGLIAAVNTMTDNRDYIQKTSVSGNEVNDTLCYFFALIGMACMFGSFNGMTSAMNLRADRSALASRRCIAPTRRIVLVAAEMAADFTVQFLNICILLLYLRFVLGISFGEKWFLLLPVCVFGSITGVAFGMFIGSMRFTEGVKTGMLISSSLLMSFFAGLMIGGMKYVIEKNIPILNRINPAALIADAFYCISVYDNPDRYCMNLILLALLALLLTAAGYVKLGRERYDSL